MTDWLLKCHTQMCYYYYYCYLTFLSPSTEPGVVVEGIERKGLEVHQLRMEVLEDPQGAGAGFPRCLRLLLRTPLSHQV